MKSYSCFFMCALVFMYSNTVLAESKIKFDSQSFVEVKKIRKNKAFRQEVVKKDFKKLSKQVSDLDSAEQRRIAKQGSKNPAVLQAADDKVRDKIQDIAQFVQSSSISEADPDFSHAILSKLSALTKARRDGQLSQNATAMSASRSAASFASPQERISEIQSLLKKQEQVVGGI